jgi:hypothetical protein
MDMNEKHFKACTGKRERSPGSERVAECSKDRALLVFMGNTEVSHLMACPWPSSVGLVLSVRGCAWGCIRSTTLSLGVMPSGLAPVAMTSEGSLPLFAPV